MAINDSDTTYQTSPELTDAVMDLTPEDIKQRIYERDTGVEPELRSAVIEQESRYNPYAKNPKSSAYGLGQVINSTWKAYGGGARDDVNEQLRVSNAVLHDELLRFSGNMELAVAAYHDGPNNVIKALKSRGYSLKQAGNVSFDEIADSPLLTDEGKKYVPQVMGRYSKKKVSENGASSGTGIGTRQDLLDKLNPEISSTDFASRKPSELFKLLQDIHNNYAEWDEEAQGLFKELSTSVWGAAGTDENLPSLGDLIGAPPRIEAKASPQEVKSNLDDWRGTTVNRLRTVGADPVLFGKQFDEYFTAAQDAEQKAANYRARGLIGTAATRMTGTSRQLGRGLIGGIAMIPGSVARLGGFPETAEYIESAKNIIDEPVPDYMYQVNEEGYVQTDENGQPITKTLGSVPEIVGNLASFLIPGGLLKAAGMGTKGLAAFGLTTNSLMTANGAYMLTEQATGDREKALTAAFVAAPLGVLGAAGDMAAWSAGKPWVAGMSPLRQAQFLAKRALTKGPLSGAAFAAQEAATQAAASGAVGQSMMDPERILETGIAGTIAGGLYGAAEAPFSKDPAAIAAAQAARQAKAAAQPKPVTGRPDSHEQVLMAKHIEEFARGAGMEEEVPLREAADVDPELFSYYPDIDFQILDNGTRMRMTRKANYVPKQGETPEAASIFAKNQEEQLKDMPAADIKVVQKLQEEWVKAAKDVEEYPAPLKERLSDIEKAWFEKEALERQLKTYELYAEEAGKSGAHESMVIAKRLVDSTKQRLADYSIHNEDFARIESKLRLRELNNELNKYKNPHYEADRAMREKELQDNLRLKQAAYLEEQAKAKEAKPDETGKPKETKPVLSPEEEYVAKTASSKVDTAAGPRFIQRTGNLYHVSDMEGNLISGDHTTWADAYSKAVGLTEDVLGRRARPRQSTVDTNPPPAGFTPQVLDALGFEPEVPIARDSQVVFPANKVTGAIRRAAAVAAKLAKKQAVGFREGGRAVRGAKGAAGYFDPRAWYAYMARANDPVTAAHELTHAIQWTHDIDPITLPSVVKRGLRRQGVTFYGDRTLMQQGEHRILTEGLANFFEHYVTGQRVHKDVLNWFNTEFATQHPKTYKEMMNVKAAMNSYLRMDPVIAAKAFMSGRLSPKAKTTLGDFRDQWINSEGVITEMDNAVGPIIVNGEYQAKNLTDYFDYFRGWGTEKAAQLVHRSVTDDNNRVIGDGKSLVEGIEPAKQAKMMDELMAYMMAKRTVTTADRKIASGFEMDHAYAILDKIETTRDSAGNNPYQPVIDSASAWWDWTLKRGLVAAQINPRFRAHFASLIEANIKNTGQPHGYYFPLAREITSVMASRGRIYLDRTDPMKPLRGSWRSVVNPLVNVENATRNLLATVVHDNQRQLIAQMADMGDTAIGNFIRRIPREQTPALKAHLSEIKERLKKKLSDFGLTDQDINWDTDPLAQWIDILGEEQLTFWRPETIPPNPADGYITIAMQRGPKPTDINFYEVHPRLMRALHPEMPNMVNHPFFNLFFRMTNTAFKVGATGFRLAWQLKNFAGRDFYALYRSQDKVNPLPIAAEVLRSLMDEAVYSLSGGKIKTRPWVEVIKNSGSTASTLARSSRDLDLMLAKNSGKQVLNIADKTLDYITYALGVGERATRNAAFILKGRELGVDPTKPIKTSDMIEMVLAAKRSTTDYSKMGSSTKVVNMMVPFFSARLAQLSRLPRDYKEHPGKFIGTALSFFGLGLYQALSNKDEKFYQNMEPEEKASNFITDVGDRIIRVPLEELAGIFNGLGIIVGEGVARDDNLRASVLENIAAVAKNYAPISHWSDLMGVPLREAWMQQGNIDYFTKRAIVPKQLEDVPKTQQYTSGTTEFAKGLSSTLHEVGSALGLDLDIAPTRIDHAMRGLFPASVGMARWVEEQAGMKPVTDKVQGVPSLLSAAFMRYGYKSSSQDRSTRMFYDLHARYRANKDIETENEKQIRLKLEKVREGLSAFNAILTVETDQSLRSDAYEKKQLLLENGLAIARGEQIAVIQTPEVSRAKLIREQRKQERKLRLQAQGSDLY